MNRHQHRAELRRQRLKQKTANSARPQAQAAPRPASGSHGFSMEALFKAAAKNGDLEVCCACGHRFQHGETHPMGPDKAGAIRPACRACAPKALAAIYALVVTQKREPIPGRTSTAVH